jgi:hypothetical protein
MEISQPCYPNAFTDPVIGISAKPSRRFSISCLTGYGQSNAMGTPLNHLDYRAVLARRFRFLPRRMFSVVLHAIYHHELMALRDPQTFTQLLSVQNMKAADPLISLTTDKYTAREYITERVGEQHLVPLVQVVDAVEDLDIDNLPIPCVLKATHGYAMNLFLSDDYPIDKDEIRTTIKRWLNTDFYRSWKERPYVGLTPRCVVEEFLGDGPDAPHDYKFHMFNGKLGLLQVHEGRFSEHRVFSFDGDLNRLAIRGIYPAPPRPFELPSNYEQMLEIAEKLSAEFECVRIDLYSIKGHTYVGEMTHNPGGCVETWNPKSFDLALGDFWRNGAPIPEEFFMSV